MALDGLDPEVLRVQAQVADEVAGEQARAEIERRTAEPQLSRAQELGAEWDKLEAPLNDGWQVSW